MTGGMLSKLLRMGTCSQRGSTGAHDTHHAASSPVSQGRQATAHR